MPRYKLTLEYDGSRFNGWQRQSGCTSVQQTLEQALEKMFSIQVRVEGAGRTDAGVHALGQVAHIDLPHLIPAYRVCDGLNYYLHNQGVTLLSAETVPAGFHARFSAVKRVYEYHILNRRAPAVLHARQVWHVITPLDVGKMQAAASYFTGHHDFTSFRATNCQAASPFRTLDGFQVTHTDHRADGFFQASSSAGIHIKARVESRSFLHNQVRIMMGTLKLVGEGRLNPADIPSLFAARARSASGPTAPPQGLYLKSISY